MTWLQRLNDRQRHHCSDNLADSYSSLLARLGAVSPFELAVLGARAMPTPGLAFLLGYQAALRVLWPSAPASLGALCASERRSVRPADMQVRLDDLRLSGSKDFVTAGLDAEWLLVAARSEVSGESPQVSLAVVYPGEPGVRLEPLPALPLMPEVGHARLHLDQALCERLAGDGWDAYVKPFRTLEDLYVLSALCAWLYGVGQDNGWPQALQLRLIGLLGGCAEGSRQCADATACHLLLGGLFAQFAALKDEINQALSLSTGEWAALWQRDQGLLEIASAARAKRLAKAWASAGLS
ncbi:acyl-CoA dehydrogenase [Pseudomonas sp. P66]|jgi:alkylation response protein AidB-like acyl-CoA dehydrogenase|uniref:Acyl-CoA dehydrogenase n=1 Tax=Pseudomonas arcuscaelestis TaxID=2710591 RepID=A0ABS2C2N1_9PSED|nr:acyl-CoA dehydrogenase [Pseudomonas arcuscaelestis]MBM3108835.1 acyl-CoA dehydrogenase [Pseudomonas arcuscaelestis]MBM3110317.1 acyl-CoA dehydrogenase [Pseudomonas arcuscaelestis]MBM5460122.1 acyl-CoA dehydrogenase [Pseudomonas arcuscaelestis]